MPKYLKSNRFSNEYIRLLCEHSIDYIDEILDHFNIEYRQSGNRILGPCPIHDGDNKTAFNLYIENEVPGFWVCNTHYCHKRYWQNIIGLVHALANKNKDYHVNEAIAWLSKFTGFKTNINTVDIKPRINAFNYTKKRINVCSVSRNKILQRLSIPSEYYLNRNYSSYILSKYDIGICHKTHRTFFPIYNDEYTRAVGFVGRSIYEKCKKCNGYHSPKNDCSKGSYPKWINAPKELPKTEYLFNHWFAKPYIQKTKMVIITEGAGDVLRLEDNNIHNSVATFGINLSQQQKNILEQDGVITIIALFDNDKAGKEAKDKLYKELRRDFKLIFPELKGKDIGDGNGEDLELIRGLL